MKIHSPRQLIQALPQIVTKIQSDALIVVALEQGKVHSHLVVSSCDFESNQMQFLQGVSRRPEVGLVAICYIEDSEEARIALNDLRVAAETAGIHVLDLLHVFKGRWRSMLCEDDSCCPTEGNPCKAQPEGEALGSESMTTGALDATELLTLCVLSPEQEELSKQAFVALPVWPTGSPSELFDWRNQAVEEVLLMLENQLQDPWGALAAVSVALHDIRVRDGVLRRILERHELRDAILANLQTLYGIAPSQYRAAIATVFAGTSWLSGHQALTRHAIDIALEADGDYSLARLLDTALVHGVPHKVWVESLTAVAYERCLAGAA